MNDALNGVCLGSFRSLFSAEEDPEDELDPLPLIKFLTSTDFHWGGFFAVTQPIDKSDEELESMEPLFV